MSATPKYEEIAALHALYVRETGLEIRLDMQRERDWFEWMARGFMAGDLRQVIFHVKRGIRAGTRNRGALKFHNLICQVDYFEEDLAEARKFSPLPANSTREGGAPRRPDQPPARGPGIHIENPEAAKAAFDEFKRLKGKL